MLARIYIPQLVLYHWWNTRVLVAERADQGLSFRYTFLHFNSQHFFFFFLFIYFFFHVPLIRVSSFFIYWKGLVWSWGVRYASLMLLLLNFTATGSNNRGTYRLYGFLFHSGSDRFPPTTMASWLFHATNLWRLMRPPGTLCWTRLVAQTSPADRVHVPVIEISRSLEFPCCIRVSLQQKTQETRVTFRITWHDQTNMHPSYRCADCYNDFARIMRLFRLSVHTLMSRIPNYGITQNSLWLTVSDPLRDDVSCKTIPMTCSNLRRGKFRAIEPLRLNSMWLVWGWWDLNRTIPNVWWEKITTICASCSLQRITMAKFSHTNGKPIQNQNKPTQPSMSGFKIIGDAHAFVWFPTQWRCIQGDLTAQARHFVHDVL